eukprot:jgi/Mesvir1/6497/Mv16766-RA.1
MPVPEHGNADFQGLAGKCTANPSAQFGQVAKKPGKRKRNRHTDAIIVNRPRLLNALSVPESLAPSFHPWPADLPWPPPNPFARPPLGALDSHAFPPLGPSLIPESHGAWPPWEAPHEASRFAFPQASERGPFGRPAAPHTDPSTSGPDGPRVTPPRADINGALFAAQEGEPPSAASLAANTPHGHATLAPRSTPVQATAPMQDPAPAHAKVSAPAHGTVPVSASAQVPAYVAAQANRQIHAASVMRAQARADAQARVMASQVAPARPVPPAQPSSHAQLAPPAQPSSHAQLAPSARPASSLIGAAKPVNSNTPITSLRQPLRQPQTVPSNQPLTAAPALQTSTAAGKASTAVAQTSTAPLNQLLTVTTSKPSTASPDKTSMATPPAGPTKGGLSPAAAPPKAHPQPTPPKNNSQPTTPTGHRQPTQPVGPAQAAAASAQARGPTQEKPLASAHGKPVAAAREQPVGPARAAVGPTLAQPTVGTTRRTISPAQPADGPAQPRRPVAGNSVATQATGPGVQGVPEGSLQAAPVTPSASPRLVTPATYAGTVTIPADIATIADALDAFAGSRDVRTVHFASDAGATVPSTRPRAPVAAVPGANGTTETRGADRTHGGNGAQGRKGPQGASQGPGKHRPSQAQGMLGMQGRQGTTGAQGPRDTGVAGGRTTAGGHADASPPVPMAGAVSQLERVNPAHGAVPVALANDGGGDGGGGGRTHASNSHDPNGTNGHRRVVSSQRGNQHGDEGRDPAAIGIDKKRTWAATREGQGGALAHTTTKGRGFGMSSRGSSPSLGPGRAGQRGVADAASRDLIMGALHGNALCAAEENDGGGDGTALVDGAGEYGDDGDNDEAVLGPDPPGTLEACQRALEEAEAGEEAAAARLMAARAAKRRLHLRRVVIAEQLAATRAELVACERQLEASRRAAEVAARGIQGVAARLAQVARGGAGLGGGGELGDRSRINGQVSGARGGAVGGQGGQAQSGCHGWDAGAVGCGEEAVVKLEGGSGGAGLAGPRRSACAGAPAGVVRAETSRQVIAMGVEGGGVDCPVKNSGQ